MFRAMVVLILLLPATSLALPEPGERLPSLTARDLAGNTQEIESIVGGQPTLLVVITSRKEGDLMKAWYEAALLRAPAGTHGAGLISIDLPFFVPESYARRRARKKVPEDYWQRVLLDGDHRLAAELGIEKGHGAYVFALDADGVVRAVFNGSPWESGADSIWEAMERR